MVSEALDTVTYSYDLYFYPIVFQVFHAICCPPARPRSYFCTLPYRFTGFSCETGFLTYLWVLMGYRFLLCPIVLHCFRSNIMFVTSSRGIDSHFPYRCTWFLEVGPYLAETPAQFISGPRKTLLTLSHIYIYILRALARAAKDCA